MLIRGEYRFALGPAEGVHVEDGEFAPFECEIDGTRVTVSPVLETRTYPDTIFDNEGNEVVEVEVEYPVMTQLVAVTEAEFADERISSVQRDQLRRPAVEALRRTVRHLRTTTKILDLDTNLRSVSANYTDDAGNNLHILFFDELFQGIDDLHELTPQVWDRAVERAKRNDEIPVADELILDAKRSSRNNRCIITRGPCVRSEWLSCDRL